MIAIIVICNHSISLCSLKIDLFGVVLLKKLHSQKRHLKLMQVKLLPKQQEHKQQHQLQSCNMSSPKSTNTASKIYRNHAQAANRTNRLCVLAAISPSSGFFDIPADRRLTDGATLSAASVVSLLLTPGCRRIDCAKG